MSPDRSPGGKYFGAFYLAGACAALMLNSPTTSGADQGTVVSIQPTVYVGLVYGTGPLHLKHYFPIINLSSRPVAIAAVEPNCTCESSPNDRVAFDSYLHPGVASRIEIEIHSNPQIGIPDIREYRVRLGGQEKIEDITLTVLAKRIGEVEVFPGRQIVITGAEGETLTKRLYLLVPRHRRVVLSSLTPQSLSVSLSESAWLPELIVPDSIRNGYRLLLLHLRSSDRLASGSYVDTVELAWAETMAAAISVAVMRIIRGIR